MRILIDFFRPILHRIFPRNRMGDKIYSFINFFINHGRFPKNRKLFNDYYYKIKTSNEILNPLRVFVSDKEFVKIYTKSVVGDEFNVPTIKVLRSYKELINYKFPSECVIKPTHLSGYVIIKKNTNKIDFEKIRKWFFMNFYERSREINYKNLKPKVIVEPIIFNEDNLKDYKFFCYKGIPKIISVDFDRYVDGGKKHKRKYLDTNWVDLKFSILHSRYEKDIAKPLNLETMISVAGKLSSNFDFVRIDLYTNNEKIFLGEITNIHGNASEHFYPPSGEKLCSEIIFG